MVHFRVFRWIGSDSSRNTSIKRREMLRSFRLCPLVWLCLRHSVEKCHFGSSACWRLLNSRPLGLIPSVDSSFTVPQPNVSWDVFLSYFSPPPHSGCHSPSFVCGDNAGVCDGRMDELQQQERQHATFNQSQKPHHHPAFHHPLAFTSLPFFSVAFVLLLRTSSPLTSSSSC